MATFDYFDMAGKGRVTQKDFIEFESPFFARFDRRHSCRVTNDDIRAANTPTQTQTPQRGGGGSAFAAIAALCSAAGFAPKVFAQQADEPLLATASEWGGQGGVYTCAQWRAYVTRMYRLGDSRHRGYIEAKDFEIIKKASPVFQMATFDYFDMTGKGRVTQKEFIEFESPFFARFDRRHTCRVTNDDIRAANTPTQTQTPQQRGGGSGGMAGGSGGLGGGFGWR